MSFVMSKSKNASKSSKKDVSDVSATADLKPGDPGYVGPRAAEAVQQGLVTLSHEERELEVFSEFTEQIYCNLTERLSINVFPSRNENKEPDLTKPGQIRFSLSGVKFGGFGSITPAALLELLDKLEPLRDEFKIWAYMEYRARVRKSHDEAMSIVQKRAEEARSREAVAKEVRDKLANV